MNSQEAAVLCRYVRALCPQQKFDEYTPDAWHDVLNDLALDDCREAAARVARRQPFVAPAEITAEVRVIRAERLEGFQYEPVPGDDNPRVYLETLRAQRAAVASGHRPAAIEHPALPGPDITEVTTHIGRTVPAEDDEPKPRSPFSVPCPKCGARLGHHCRWPGGARRTTHGARTRLANNGTSHTPDTDRIAEQRRAASAAALQQLTPEQRAQLDAMQEAQ